MRNTEKLNYYVRWMCAKNFRQTTIRSYKSALETFFVSVDKDSCRITKIDLTNYLINIPSHYSHSYRNLAINAIKSYMLVVEQKKYNDIVLPRPKTEKFIPNILTVEQVRRVIDNTRNIKHRCILQVIYDNGLRISELLNLHLCDVRSKTRNPHLIIREAKHHTARLVYLSHETIQLIKLYYAAEKPQLFLFEGQTTCKPYSKSSVHKILNKPLSAKVLPLECVCMTCATHLQPIVSNQVPIYTTFPEC